MTPFEPPFDEMERGKDLPESDIVVVLALIRCGKSVKEICTETRALLRAKCSYKTGSASPPPTRNNLADHTLLIL